MHTYTLKKNYAISNIYTGGGKNDGNTSGFRRFVEYF